MTGSSTRKRKDFNFIKVANRALEETLEEQKVDDVESLEESSNMPVPQLKVGPDGNIVLDPDSLIIERTGVEKSRLDMEKSEVIFDTGTSYGHYNKKRHHRHDWPKEDTVRFYRALSVLGTDFSLMQTLFPLRTRRELKLKFKREERTNEFFVSKVMDNPAAFDLLSLKEKLAAEDEEIRLNELRREEELVDKKEKKFVARQLRIKKMKQNCVRGGSFCSRLFDKEDTGVIRTKNSKKKKYKNMPYGHDSTNTKLNHNWDKKNVKRPLDNDYLSESKHEIPLGPSVANEATKKAEQQYMTESEDDENYLTKIIQPTRSGRQPKLKRLKSNCVPKCLARVPNIVKNSMLSSSSSNEAKQKKVKMLSRHKPSAMPLAAKNEVIPLPSISTLPCIQRIYPSNKVQEPYAEPLNLSLRFGEPSSEGDLDDNISIVSGMDSSIVRDMVSIEVPALEDFTSTVEQMNTSFSLTNISLVEPAQSNKLQTVVRYNGSIKTVETPTGSSSGHYDPLVKCYVTDRNGEQTECPRRDNSGIPNYHGELYMESDIMRICNESELSNTDYIIPHYLIEDIPRAAYEYPERSSTPNPTSQHENMEDEVQEAEVEEEEEIVVLNLDRFWPEATVVPSNKRTHIKCDVPVLGEQIVTRDIADTELSEQTRSTQDIDNS